MEWDLSACSGGGELAEEAAALWEGGRVRHFLGGWAL